MVKSYYELKSEDKNIIMELVAKCKEIGLSNMQF